MKSKGEEIIKALLLENFSFLKFFSNYPIGGGLVLDVYIPSISAAIEFDGIQHRVYSEFFHHDFDGFVKGIQNDKRKNRVCQKKGIKILRVNDELSYNEILENVREFIQSCI